VNAGGLVCGVSEKQSVVSVCEAPRSWWISNLQIETLAPDSALSLADGPQAIKIARIHLRTLASKTKVSKAQSRGSEL